MPNPNHSSNFTLHAYLEPYPAMKDSGVEWIGDVPEHWKIKRAKWLFRKMDRPVGEGDGVVTCFRDGVVTLRNNRRISGFTESLKEIGYQGIRAGDLVIHAMDAFAGAIGVADSDGKGTPVYSVCRPEPQANAHYYAFAVREMARSQWILAIARGIRERSTDFRYAAFAVQQVPLPPSIEQTAIVRFLEHMDRRIRRYIRAKQKLIGLLEEQKQAIISGLVTGKFEVRRVKGEDGQEYSHLTRRPSHLMKPSGVEWLGDVPEHWEVRKLRYCGAIAGGMTPSMELRRFWDGTIPWVTPKDMKRAAIGDSSVRVTEVALRETSLRLVEPPAILMVVRGMILARRVPIARITAPVTINQDMKALKTAQGVNAEFLARALFSAQEAFIPLIDEAGHGTRRLPTERWRDLAVAMPPENEQVTIVRLLDEAAHMIIAAITRAHREIELLREYRTRLIADVVTGKVDVRAVKPEGRNDDDDEEALQEGVQGEKVLMAAEEPVAYGVVADGEA